MDINESERYLNALVEGKDETVLEIYSKFHPKVKAFILKNKGKEEDADDVFHNALLYLIVRHKQSSLSINSFEYYFFTICKNLWRTSIRGGRNRVLASYDRASIFEEPEVNLFLIREKRMESYQDAFQQCSDNCKEILCNYFNGMSYEEILKDLSYGSINTVRQRVFKCRSKLISIIKSDNRYAELKSC